MNRFIHIYIKCVFQTRGLMRIQRMLKKACCQKMFLTTRHGRFLIFEKVNNSEDKTGCMYLCTVKAVSTWRQRMGCSASQEGRDEDSKGDQDQVQVQVQVQRFTLYYIQRVQSMSRYKYTPRVQYMSRSRYR